MRKYSKNSTGSNGLVCVSTEEFAYACVCVCLCGELKSVLSGIEQVSYIPR